MGKYFGTDGFRGEANINLTSEHAYKTGRFLGHYYKSTGGKCRVVIGKDTRRSGYMFEYSLVAGLTASGADVYLLHVTTTPSVSYVVKNDGFDFGIMISASHNPYYDNGIKVINGKGEKLEDAVIEKIEEYLDGKVPEIPFATRDNIGCTVDYVEGREKYAEHLVSIMKHSFAGKKVALDCANGSAWQLGRKIFNALGAETVVIGNTPNGFNINDKCGSTHVENLCKLVKEQGCDIGFAYDGDADRCFAVDENGNVVDGDLTMYICANYLKDKGELKDNTVVTTVMSNLGLYKALDRAGIKYEKTAVGDRYVYENMVQNGYSIGGEQSGHIIFSKYAATGDGILTSLMIMEVVLATGKKLSELCKPVTIFPQILKNVRILDKQIVLNDADVCEAVKTAELALGDDGRILVRPSGTEPLVRVMVEAKTQELCTKYAMDVISVIENKGYIAP